MIREHRPLTSVTGPAPANTISASAAQESAHVSRAGAAHSPATASPAWKTTTTGEVGRRRAAPGWCAPRARASSQRCRCSSMACGTEGQLEGPAVRGRERAAPAVRAPGGMEVRVDAGVRLERARGRPRATHVARRSTSPTISDEQTRSKRPCRERQRAGVGADPPRLRRLRVREHRQRQIDADDQRRAGLSAAAPGCVRCPCRRRARARGEPTASIGADDRLLGLHQRVVRARRVRLGPERIGLVCRQHRGRGRTEASESAVRRHVRIPSSPAAGSASGAAAPAARTARAYTRSA